MSALVRIGSSGWSYPSWRPGFYPDGMQPAEFLGYYASRFDTVELNSTGYRLPAAEQFERWAEGVPDGFLFAPKLALRAPDRAGVFLERVARLGDRLGPVRVVVEQRRDESLVARVLEVAERCETSRRIELAFDFRHESWAGIEGVVSVGDFAAEPFSYIRLRDPPYSDPDLEALAARLGGPTYVYFRHEDAPTAPQYAMRLGELLGQI